MAAIAYAEYKPLTDAQRKALFEAIDFCKQWSRRIRAEKQMEKRQETK